MSRVIHFELPADDPERASQFYASVFGWTITKWDGPVEYWLIQTGDESEPGINGGLMRKCAEGEGFNHVVNTIGVTDLDATIEKVCAAGGEILMPKHQIPGVGWLAYAKDAEGNPFGIMQSER